MTLSLIKTVEAILLFNIDFEVFKFITTLIKKAIKGIIQ
ncbi:hypothetical protein SynA1524_00823 [Synechococcus sp. A15-24]|nr:hypothetical protein SynA1524_00823 [Synechococcus sp. A15-24]